MPVNLERLFQLDICNYLSTHNWLWDSPSDLALNGKRKASTLSDAKGYNKELALFPEDIFTYLEETQATEWAKLFAAAQSTAAVTSIKEALLKEIAKRLDKAFRKSGGGLICAVSNPFKFTHKGITVTFTLAQLAPENANNPILTNLYGKNRLRVVDELLYSAHKQDRIDLVLFLNGLPIFTVELKNGSSQNYKNAIEQYKHTRTPWAETPNKSKIKGAFEPLLNGKRAIAHFAVDPENVYLSTKLDGRNTIFLPFNAGGDEASPAKNKAKANSRASSYLWEDIFHTHTVLDILKTFVVQKVNEDSHTKKQTEETVFPRFHQWFGTTLALACTLREGLGGKSLMMWSAGSGKSNGISWLAHALNGLHYESIPYALDNLSPMIKAEVLKFVPKKLHANVKGKMFTGGGWVVTDRTNLDNQIGETVQSKGSAAGTVVQIGKNLPAGLTSKTKHIVDELNRPGSSIKIITLQTFPYALDAIELKLAEERGNKINRLPKTYFVLRDEAHSAEGGKATQALMELLNSPTYSNLLPAEELKKIQVNSQLDTFDQNELLTQLTDLRLSARQKSRSDSSNISYFAFTATPKPETLERFGRVIAGTSSKVPLHTYSMQQAIDEGYIKDVLLNYTPYELLFKLSADSRASQRVVDEHKARPALLSWVRQQPKTLAAKAEIIVEHFDQIVFPGMENRKSQAMVFASSRMEALLLKRELDAVIKSQGLIYKTLVAFTGELTDMITGELVTEGSENGTGSRDIATVFEKDTYHILVVANKYQTGYDNIRLNGGYIDKKIQGVEAVQLMSRLNRIAPQLGKNEVHILDFINDAEVIYSAFSQYYGTLGLEEKLNPNALNEVQLLISAYGLYTPDQVSDYAEACFLSNVIQSQNIIFDVRGRYRTRKEAAEESENNPEVQYYNAYLSLLKRYVEIYGFQSTIIDFGDSELEKLVSFYSELHTALNLSSFDPSETGNTVNLDGIGILSSALRKKENKNSGVKPISMLTSKELHDLDGVRATTPEMVRLQALIQFMNDLFGSIENLNPNDYEVFVEHLIGKVLANKEFGKQARSNSRERFSKASEKTEQRFLELLVQASDSYSSMVNKTFEDKEVQEEFRKRIFTVAHDRFNEKQVS